MARRTMAPNSDTPSDARLKSLLLMVPVPSMGAMLGGWFLAPMLGTGTINNNDFSLASLGVSLLGAIVLLAIVNLVRRGTAR
ncbi:MAG: GlsB/YeaQ/YmgE family stress response membrane protein [Oxalobacteraceae bacterium]|nr:MAG: GlsB/YeaQ/YmgE family stress response membrane protein [Oxalobacteraceae bacterium]